MQSRLRHSGALMNSIGGSSSGSDWINYWVNQNIFDFLWNGRSNTTELIDISGNGYNAIITGKDFTGNYIPATSSSNFKLPDNATIKADDTDFLWHGGAMAEVTAGDLSSHDYPRTIVKYDNITPYHIRAIGLLKSSITLTSDQKDRLSKDFQLDLFFFGVENDYGVVKENRPSAAVPTFISAVVETANKNKILVTLSGNVDAGTGTTTTNWLPSGGKIVTGVSIAGTVVTLTCNADYAAADTITISYTREAANPLLVGGEKVLNFLNQSVTNNVLNYPATLDNTSETVGWFRADDLTTITKDAGTGEVSSWRDKNGTGHNLVQATATKYPIWAANIISLDGINDYLKCAGFALIQPEYIYIVMKDLTGGVGGPTFFDGNATNTGRLFHGATEIQIVQYAGAFVNKTTAHALNTWEIIRVFFNGAASKTIVGTSTVSGGNAGAANMGGFTLGDVGGSGAPAKCDVKEVIVRKVDDTADGGANETAIYNYLKAKYSL